MKEARVRIKSVRPKAGGAKLMLFPSKVDFARTRILSAVRDIIDDHDGQDGAQPICGMMMVLWDASLTSSVTSWSSKENPLPSIAAGEFFRSRVEAGVLLAWIDDE